MPFPSYSKRSNQMMAEDNFQHAAISEEIFMIQNMYLEHRTLYGPWLIFVIQTFNKRKFIKQRKKQFEKHFFE